MLRHLPWNTAAPALTGASSKGSAPARAERALSLSPDATRTARQYHHHQGFWAGGRQSGPTIPVREGTRIPAALSASASFPRRRARMAAVACCCFLPVLGFGAASRTHWAAAAAADVHGSATLPKVALLRGSGRAASGDQKRHVRATGTQRAVPSSRAQGRGARVSSRPPQPIRLGSEKPQEQPRRLRSWHHSASLRNSGISRSTGSSPPLHDLLPDDLDELRSSAVMAATGVQLLLFGGFVLDHTGCTGWTKDTDPPLDLKQRLKRITPTWKPGGTVDYSWVDDSDDSSNRKLQLPASGPAAKAPLSLFGAARAPPTAIRAGATVASMCRALEDIGLSSEDFADAPSRKALKEMLRWRIDDTGPRKDGGIVSAAPITDPSGSASGKNNDVTLLVLSFDATPSCRGLDDCPLPGPSNELLAATAAAFAAPEDEDRRRGASTVKVVAQWEVAAAIGALQRHQRRPASIDVTAVGTPGLFENTAQILEMMRDHVCGQRVILLAHPDHLPRVLRTANTVLGGNWSSSSTNGDAAAAAAAPPPPPRPCPNEGPLELLPAMLPYSLDWPSTRRPAEKLDLYESVEAMVHSQGGTTLASWYSDPRAGFFPDGDPQRWAHRREVWVLYDHWARAKGIATGIIRADDADAADGRRLTDLL